MVTGIHPLLYNKAVMLKALSTLLRQNITKYVINENATMDGRTYYNLITATGDKGDHMVDVMVFSNGTIIIQHKELSVNVSKVAEEMKLDSILSYKF